MENIQTEPRGLSLQIERPALWRPTRAWMNLVLVSADLLGLYLAGGLAAWLRTLLLGPARNSQFEWILPLGLVMVLVFWVRGLYPAAGLGVVEELRGLAVTTTLLFIISGSVTFMLHVETSFSRLVFVLTWLFALGLLPLMRVMLRHAATRLQLWGEPVAMIGGLEAAARQAGELRANPKTGLRPAAILSPAVEGQGLEGRLPVFPLEALPEVREKLDLRCAVVVYESLSELAAIREQFRDAFERVVLLPANGSGPDLSGVTLRQYGQTLSVEIRYTLLDPWAQAVKRLVDLVGAGLGLLLLSPLLLLTAALIYLDSPGRVFYRQRRVGRGGRDFNLLKFRSMHLNADQVLQEYLAQNPQAQAEWESYQKLGDDPRITRVGCWLRRYSLDELPQLWNVLKGEMSLVGPRPMMVNQVEIYGAGLKYYIRVRPGISGLWQISGRNQTTFAQRAHFDMQYVMNWSIWLDIYILLRTVWVVLRREGAC